MKHSNRFIVALAPAPAPTLAPAPFLVILLAIVGTALGAPPVMAQADRFAEVKITSEQVGDNLWVLQGAGGNMALSSGPDGAFLVDDQYAPLTERILAAIAELTDQQVRFVLNTHWHFDHTGGNENLGKTGTVLVAHDNVRARMSVDQVIEAFDMKVPASPAGALPVVTFPDSITFHLNGDEIHVFHVPPSHTDGDSIVHFKTADVIHMGDTFFQQRYPFIDVSSGGSVLGMIDSADRILGIAKETTKIIPGHGKVATRKELIAYREMLATAHARIRALVLQGLSVEQIVEAAPMADHEETWGDATGFIGFVFASVQEE